MLLVAQAAEDTSTYLEDLRREQQAEDPENLLQQENSYGHKEGNVVIINNAGEVEIEIPINRETGREDGGCEEG